MKTSEFITKLQNIADHVRTVYMWGAFGSPVTDEIIHAKSAQYPAWYTTARNKFFHSLVGHDYFAFDCVNLIKGILWGWTGDASKNYGGAIYCANGVPDCSADGMLTKLLGVSTDFKNIIPGEAVWMKGHIGIYIGNGKVIECTPVWRNGVQVTACGNIGSIKGMKSRVWAKHGKIPYLEYDTIIPPTPKPVPPTSRTYVVMSGDSLWNVAAKLLGDGKRYPEIVKLNGLTSNTLKPGQALKIPLK